MVGALPLETSKVKLSSNSCSEHPDLVEAVPAHGRKVGLDGF